MKLKRIIWIAVAAAALYGGYRVYKLYQLRQSIDDKI